MRRLVVTGGALIAVTYGLARFALGLFVPEFRATFDLSATAVGAMMSASFAGYVIGLMAAGPLVGRTSARTVAWSSGLVASAGMAAVALAPHPLLLGVAAGIGGASTGLASPALAAAVEGRLTAVQRPVAQTAINSGTSIGLVAAVPVATLLAATWRAAWAVFAVVALVTTLSFVASVPAGVRATPPAARTRPRPLSTRLSVSAGLLGLSSAAFWSFARDLLETSAGHPPAVSRLAWVAAGAVGVAGASAGSVVRRVGLRAAVAGSGIVLTVALGMLATSPPGPLIALGAAGLFGAAYMAMTGLLIIWSVSERPEAPASGVATAFLLLAVGQVLGSLVAGAIGDQAGLPVAFSTATVAAAATSLVLPPGSSARRSARQVSRPMTMDAPLR